MHASQTFAFPQADTLNRLVRGPVVTIDVGVAAGKGRFLVHKPLLSHHSRFFAGALNGGFKEAVTEHVDLPADDPQVFAFIAAWMYSGNLDVLDHHRKANDRQLLPDEVPRAACETLAEIYYLADRLDMPILQAEVVENLDAAVKSAGDYLPLTAETVIEIWENTVESSELRR